MPKHLLKDRKHRRSLLSLTHQFYDYTFIFWCTILFLLCLLGCFSSYIILPYVAYDFNRGTGSIVSTVLYFSAGLFVALL